MSEGGLARGLHSLKSESCQSHMQGIPEPSCYPELSAAASALLRRSAASGCAAVPGVLPALILELPFCLFPVLCARTSGL